MRCNHLLSAVTILWMVSAGVTVAQPEPLAALQTLLSERGCDTGPIDGVWGRKTNDAYEALAQRAGLPATRPVTEATIAALSSTEVTCSKFAGMSVVEAAHALSKAELRGWQGHELYASAKANEEACKLSPRESWVGQRVIEKEITIIGDDLAAYYSNTDALLEDIHRLNARAAATADFAELKTVILEVIEKNGFSQMTPYRPLTWEGRRPDWMDWYANVIPEAEPAFNAAMLMLATSVSYALLEAHFSPKEKEDFRAWGRGLYDMVMASDKDGMNTKTDRDSAPDRRAGYVAGFVAWGSTVKDHEIFLQGASLFQEAVSRIRTDGTERGFVEDLGDQDHNAGLQLKYLTFAYGLLTVAAHVLELNDITAFRYRAAGAGSLADGLAYHLAATADPAHRHRIQVEQDVIYSQNARHWGPESFAFLPFVERSGAIASSDPYLQKYLTLGDDPLLPGFAGTYFGGYTTCLYSG